MEPQTESPPPQTDTVELPAPTAWPMVLALGLSLIAAGMVTNAAISILGLALTLRAAAGWFLQVLPAEHCESVSVRAQAIPVVAARASVGRLSVAAEHRRILPAEAYKLSSGIKGGLAGGVAMAIPAMLYGFIEYRSIWYAVNLLAAGGFVSWAGQSNAFLAEFHLRGLLAALAIHGSVSLLVGLLYGAMLPMFPRWPILTCGFVAPLLWTGLSYSILGIVSPILDKRIDWLWFTVSQCAFGLVAGFVVNLDARVRTPQFRALPFAVRAGLHTDFGEPPAGEPANKPDREDGTQ